MMSKRSMPAIAALCLGGVAAIAIPAGVAVGQSSPPSKALIIQSKGVIRDRGVRATVKVYVACPAGEQDYVDVQLSERARNDIASGYGNEDFYCTGQIEILSINVVAQNHPFRKGSSYVQAYDADSGGQASRTVHLAPPS